MVDAVCHARKELGTILLRYQNINVFLYTAEANPAGKDVGSLRKLRDLLTLVVYLRRRPCVCD